MNTIELFKLILNCFEATACLVGFLYWNKIKHSHWKYFPFYLLIIVLAEFIGKYLNHSGHNDLKVGLYNYFVIPLEILFFSWLFYMEFREKKYRRVSLLMGCIYVVTWLLEMFVISKGNNWWVQSFSYTVGIIVLIVQLLLFLFILATGDDILYIRSNMMFWVCLGLFIFYFCTLPFFGMGNYLFNHFKNIYFGYAYAIYILNYIMYSLFITAFIWGRPRSLHS